MNNMFQINPQCQLKHVYFVIDWLKMFQVEKEISFQICSDSYLREPFIAHAVSKLISSETALFIGNSMAIRDADMYGHSGTDSSPNNIMLGLGLPFQGIMIAGNRGASGIDGLLSTAIGFAVGCQKRVSLFILYILVQFSEFAKTFFHELVCNTFTFIFKRFVSAERAKAGISSFIGCAMYLNV